MIQLSKMLNILFGCMARQEFEKKKRLFWWHLDIWKIQLSKMPIPYRILDYSTERLVIIENSWLFMYEWDKNNGNIIFII